MSEQPPDLKKITDGLSKLSYAMRGLGDKIAKALDRFNEALQEGLHKAYADAGKPYGDTEEGFNRWVAEKMEEARHGGF